MHVQCFFPGRELKHSLMILVLTAAGYSDACPEPGSDSHLWHHRNKPIVRHGHSGQAYSAGLALAE
jgi:hypothetical protein